MVVRNFGKKSLTWDLAEKFSWPGKFIFFLSSGLSRNAFPDLRNNVSKYSGTLVPQLSYKSDLAEIFDKNSTNQDHAKMPFLTSGKTYQNMVSIFFATFFQVRLGEKNKSLLSRDFAGLYLGSVGGQNSVCGLEE